jgi:tagatose-1,6-bisphosphate aldolase non-catalytic subunit AgaZ/GatZ
VILELARSEQTYTFQRPIDYATSVLAGAIAAGWRGPVFIQGDHYQFNAKKYAADPEAMTEEIRRACRLAVEAGYRNIDIDSSTLVDLSKPTVDAQQRENYVRAAELTALIRTLEADGVTISVGGEIGEVGHKNSTVEELRAYLDGYRRELDALAPAPSASPR